jgi:hypothetical protein
MGNDLYLVKLERKKIWTSSKIESGKDGKGRKTGKSVS